MKKILVMCLSLCISLCANAQATDLVVDCQTPGWLSSKINYGDQLTVKNLKVTGYINETDLKFIASLFNKELNGVVDLGDVTIDGGSWDGSFTKSFEEDKYHLQKLILPKTLSNYEEDGSTYTVEVDTLVFDINVKVIKGYDYAHHNDRTDTKRTLERKIGHLIIGERTDSILNVGRAESVHFPRSLRYLENYACSGKNDFTNWNIKEFPNLKFLGHCAFTYNTNGSIYGDTPSLNNQTLPDSIFLPQIIVFNMASFDYKEGMHIFLGEHFRYFSYGDGVSWSYPYKPTIRNISFHMKKLPDSRGIGWCDSSVKVYIPKGTTQEWIAAGFTNVTLIEDPQPLEGIELNFHEINLEVNESVSLIATPIPANADNVDFIWSSDNLDVCTVNAEGVVKALKSGKSNIITMSSDGIIRDTCKVTVIAHADSIALSDNSIELSNIGESYKLEASVFPDNAINKSVTWKSYNEQVCTVSDEGLVTATGIGSTLVTATTVDGGLTANCVVKVVQHVEKVSLNKVALELKVNESEQLVANVTPNNADNKALTWLSSNNQIVTVDANGNIQALKAGEAWVKAISVDNTEAKDSCKVTVIQPVTGVTVSLDDYTFDYAGESIQLVATVLPEDASNKEVRWTSSNENVCIVQNGLVTAIASGTATVTATTIDGDYTANCIIKVIQHVTKVEVNKSDISLKVGESEHLTATVSPANAENKGITWSSSNNQIATVDANGNVQALKAGDAWIRAVSVDNTEAKDSCKLTVIQPATGITISQPTIQFTNIGENIQLEVTVLPEDASNKEVTWTSSNESVCMVANGKVVATGYGTAVVMAITTDGGFMANCSVIVEKETVPVTSIEISQTSANLKIGETLQLIAIVNPSDATNKNVIWKSSNESACIVSQSGYVVAVGEGRSFITVVPENGVGQAQCEVTVESVQNGIMDISNDDILSDTPIYDMMGRRVTHMRKDHLYIHKGKKIILKKQN